MRTWKFGKCRKTEVFFRLCLVIIVTLTMSLGSLALDTRPVRAIGINAAPGASINVNECQPFTIQFTATGTVCPPPPNPFFWVWPGLPPYATMDMNTGLLTGCPQVGDASAVFFLGVSEFSPPFCGPFNNAIVVTINVVPAAPVCDMVIDPTFYAVAWEGLPFAMPLSVTGGVGPFFWSAAGLPAGLTVSDPVNGIIDGVPGPGTCGI